MTHVYVAPLGLDFTQAAQLRRMASASPECLYRVLTTKPGGGEHLVSRLPNVDVLIMGRASATNLAVHLSNLEPATTITIDGSADLARATFPLLGDGTVRNYRAESVTAPSLHAEMEELDVSRIDRLIVHNALQSEIVVQMVGAEEVDKVELDTTWQLPDSVVPDDLTDHFDGGLPVVWSGSLSTTGSGFRDFARLFGHLRDDVRPVAVLHGPPTPAEFDDFTSNLGWSGALPRLMVFTAPPLEFVRGLMSSVARAGGVFVSTAIDALPNPLMTYADAHGVPMVGYENRAFDGAPWRGGLPTCDQGDISTLASLISECVVSRPVVTS